ncbi:MAG: Uma2 family endonuclease, partial [Chloroflexota bacterium]|nr:Uma2 family endonuclease [Chloroflexota bacterium]
MEREATYKSEYINGQILAMAAASVQHNTITANLVRALGNQLADRPCHVFSSDMRVKVVATGLYAYPDGVAVCGELQLDEAQSDTLTKPPVIVEVLSPSTEAYDRGEKFAHYRRLASLTDYVLIAQDKLCIEHYVRQGTGWFLNELDAIDGTLRLASIGCEVPLRDMY